MFLKVTGARPAHSFKQAAAVKRNISRVTDFTVMDKGRRECEGGGRGGQTCFSAVSTETFLAVPLPHVDVAAARLGEGLPTDPTEVRLLACRGQQWALRQVLSEPGDH